METKEALTIIQNIINAGIQKGLFVSMDDAATATIAYKVIEQALTQPEVNPVSQLTEKAQQAVNGQ